MTTRPRVLVLHGPNLSLLGEREPGIYGQTSLSELNASLMALGDELGVEVDCVQSNSEGGLIDALIGGRHLYRGVVFNPAGYTHTSVALQDTMRALSLPVIEVHMSNLWARTGDGGDFRGRSITGAAAAGVVMGLGVDSYKLALRQLALRTNA